MWSQSGLSLSFAGLLVLFGTTIRLIPNDLPCPRTQACFCKNNADVSLSVVLSVLGEALVLLREVTCAPKEFHC
jgi:hypothetical protein